MTQSTTRFVLISTARSGTTVVIRTLGTHADVQVHEEIFHKKRTQDNFSAAFLETHDLQTREDDPVRFAYQVLAHSDGPKCVGFKMWHGQSPAAGDALLQDPTVHKIVLERTNKLGGFTSRELALKTGVWHRTSNRDRNAGRIGFDESAFRQYLRAQTRYFRRARSIAQGPCLFFTYAEILAGQFDRILSFLNLDPLSLDVPLSKLNSTNLLDRILPEDHDRVRAVLDDIGHPEWVVEG